MLLLQQAQQSLAVQTGKIGTADIKRQGSYAHIPKEQIIEELMLEYLKITLGKSSLLEKKSGLGDELIGYFVILKPICISIMSKLSPPDFSFRLNE